MIRSYSRPSWPPTRSSAARIWRATSDLLKFVTGSLRNGATCVVGRTGASTVAMILPREGITKNPTLLFYTLVLHAATGPSLGLAPDQRRPATETGSYSAILSVAVKLTI